jgi:hypothetical protein
MEPAEEDLRFGGRVRLRQRDAIKRSRKASMKLD